MAVKEFSSEASSAQRPDNLNYNICKILAYIEEISQDIEDPPAVCRQIVNFLCHVEVPHQPDQIPAFREKIKKVDQFLETLSEINPSEIVTICLSELYKVMRKNEPMSSAAGIVLHRIHPTNIQETAKLLLVGSGYTSDEDLRRGVTVLISWITSSHFIANLQHWIVGILRGLCDLKKYALLMDIAEKNIDQLLNLASLPVYNAFVWSIILHMLASVQNTPVIFDRVVKLYLKSHPKQLPVDVQQAERLENTIAALLLHFPNRPYTEQLTQKLNPTSNFRDSLDVPPWHDQTKLLRRNRNVRVGLINLGNTCYMNSVLQALMLSKQFTRELLLTDVRTPLFQNMQRLMALLLHSDRTQLTPNAVLQAARPPGFHPGHEQDSSEFLGHLLDQLHEQEKGKLQHQQSLMLGAIQQQQKQQLHQQQQQQQPRCSMSLDDDDLLLQSPPPESVITAMATSNAASLSDQQQQPSTSSSSFSSSSSSSARNISSMSTDLCSAVAASLASTSSAASCSASSSDNSTGGGAGKLLSPTTTVIQRSFGGIISITYKCLECQTESKQFDSFRDLHLSFPDPEALTSHSVQELLDFYCTPERLDADNKYYCEQCKRLCVGQRYIDIVQAPRCLILTLKHFKYDQKFNMRAKLMHKVHHDEVLSVPVCSGGDDAGGVGGVGGEAGRSAAAAAQTLTVAAAAQTLYYRLYAAVVHSGVSMETGHYFTYGTDATGQCYRFDDSYVSKANTAELDRLQPPQTPYILFYQHIDDVVAQAQAAGGALGGLQDVSMHSPRKSAKLVACTSPASSSSSSSGGQSGDAKKEVGAASCSSLGAAGGSAGSGRAACKSTASTSLAVGGGGCGGATMAANAAAAASALFDYPALEDLPPHLREHVNRDNIAYSEEAQRGARDEMNNSSSVMARNRRNDTYRRDDGDDDDDSNGPTGSCGPSFAQPFNRYIS